MTEAGHNLEPLRFTVRVRRPVAEAFRLFTEGVGSWWPVETRFARGRVERVVFEARLDGRVYEVGVDGQSADWGRVLVWEPPHRLVLAWHPGRAPEQANELEVHFTPVGEGVTRVDLEQRGWERLGTMAGFLRECYQNGWPGVLEAFRLYR